MPAAADLRAIVAEAERAFAAASSLQELIEARARFLGKKGSLSAVLKQPRWPRAGRARATRRRGQRGEGADRSARGRAARSARARRADPCARERPSRRLAPRCGSAARAPPSRQRDRARGCRLLHHARLLDRGRARDRDRVEQLRRAERPGGPPVARPPGHFFVEGGHVLRTHTSPVQMRGDDGPHAAVPLRGAGPRLPSRPRRHALSDVPPDRGLLRRRGRHASPT